MKIWDIATSNRGGQGLASFVGTMSCPALLKENVYFGQRLPIS